MKISQFNDIYKDLCFWKENFINEKKALSSSKNTIKIYSSAINEFIEFCLVKQNEIEFKIDEINKFIITMFLNYLKDKKHYSSSTVKLYFETLKQFLKFITENNRESIDLYTSVEKLKIKTELKETPFYTFEEINKTENFLKEKIAKTENTNILTKYIALLLLIYTGMRADEVLNILYKNFTVSEKSGFITIKIKGKGSKERIIYLNISKIIKELDRYFERRPESVYLICDKKGNKIKYNTLYKTNIAVCKELGIQNKGIHAYRHAFARMWINSNYDLQTLKEWLGHGSITTTSRFYARSNESAKMRIAKNI